MLDHNEPSARLLAKMRAITRAAKAPDDLADRLEVHPKMNADLAGALVRAHKRLVPIAERLKLSEAETIDAVMKAVPQNGEVTDPDELFQAGLAAVQTVWAAAGDADIAMPGPSEAERAAYLADKPVAASVGADWTGGRALARKQADAVATMVAERLGLTHQPTLGREFMADDPERSKVRMAHAAALAAGERGLSDREALKLWMSGTTSTSDYATIAASSVEVVVARALEQHPIGLRQATHQILSSDWRGRNHWSLSGANVMETVNEGGEPKHLVIDEKGEALAAPARKAGFFRATEELMRNAARSTDLEVALARAMIEGAQETLRAVIAEAVANPGTLSDGVDVFDASRGNLADTAADITVTSVSAARVGLSRMTDTQGTRRPVEGSLLLVAPEQRTQAEKIAADIAAAQVDQVNPLSGRLTVISDPGLSGDAWYLLGAPSSFDGLALILMDDMQSPMIEAQPSWTSFGMEWRAQWPMACSWVRPSWFETETPSGD